MAIKDFYPVIIPTLDLNFAGSGIVDPRITFSRSGTGNVAGYFDEKGVMKFAPSNVPRIDFDPVTGGCKGLLIEEQRTNLLTYSEQFDNAVWNKTNTTVTANAIVSPSGVLTAGKVVETATTGEHNLSISLNVTSGVSYNFTLFAKAGERSRLRILFSLSGFGSDTQDLFNLSTGTVEGNQSGGASIFSIGNGWYRVAVTKTAIATTTSTFQIRVCKTEGSTYYTGDGTSGIYLWGAQLEQGAFPTSYIPTTTAQVTRAADSASLTGANFSSWYKQDEGTLFAEWATTTVISQNILGVFSVSDGTTNERIQIRRNAGSFFVSFIAVDGGITQYGDVSLPFNGSAKSALAYKTNDFIGASNGALGVAATSGTLPTVSQADIGFGSGISQLNGHIKRIAYYPKRLSNINLQALTT